MIYAESRFRDDQTSPAGTEGLMQVTPATARMIARKSGGTAFVVEDLGTPQVNIGYGGWYLRYLLARYGGNEVFALAAYNGAEGPRRPLDRGRARAPRGTDHRCDPGPTSTGCSRRAPGTGAPQAPSSAPERYRARALLALAYARGSGGLERAFSAVRP